MDIIVWLLGATVALLLLLLFVLWWRARRANSDVKVTLTLPHRTKRRIEEMQERGGMEDEKEVFARALTLYFFMQTEVLVYGREFILRETDLDGEVQDFLVEFF